MSTAAQPFCRQVNDYSGLVNACRDRSEQMELSRLELDAQAGLCDGHSDKILRPRPEKKFGIMSLGAILQTLGLILVIVEDPVARDKTLARRTPFDAGNRRVGNQNRLKSLAGSDGAAPAQSVPEPPKPRSAAQITRSHLHVVQPRHKGARFGGML
jgi:hypothetical protein